MLMSPFISHARAKIVSGSSLLLLILMCLPPASLAIEPGRHFIFQQGSVSGELQCPVKNKTSPIPSPQNKDILEPPDAEELDELGILTTRLGTPGKQGPDAIQSAPVVTRPGITRSQSMRIGIWGIVTLPRGLFPTSSSEFFWHKVSKPGPNSSPLPWAELA